MLDQLERDLARALANASRVPTPDDLPARVERRARLRRRRRIAIGTGVLALAALPLLLPSTGTPTAETSSAPSSPAVSLTSAASAEPPSDSPPPSGPLRFPPSTMDVKPIDEMWPNAIVRITEGSEYAAVGLLDRDHALMTRDDRFEHVATLYSYDLRDRSKAKIADLADPPGARGYFTQDFTITPAEILWWGRSSNAMYVWSMARSGGTPQQIAKVSGVEDLRDMSAGGDAVYWTRADGGVYRLDRRTGDLGVLAGMENFRLTVFPWASSPDRAPLLHNVLTNEEIVVRAPADTSSLWCVPALCIGEGGPAFSHFAMRPNGTQRVDLMDADLRPGLLGGRYVIAASRAGYDVLIDVHTGQAARLPTGAQPSHDAVYWLEPATHTTAIFFPPPPPALPR